MSEEATMKVEDKVEVESEVKEEAGNEVFMESVRRSDEFYKALTSFLDIPFNKEPETVVKAAFGAVEFGVLVALQCGITHDDFMQTVEAVWRGIEERRKNFEQPTEENKES